MGYFNHLVEEDLLNQMTREQLEGLVDSMGPAFACIAHHCRDPQWRDKAKRELEHRLFRDYRDGAKPWLN
jgi:hypothetical protein